MRQQRKQIGLAVVGCGTIGRIRAEFARDYPGIGWLGLSTRRSRCWAPRTRPSASSRWMTGTTWSMNISWALPHVWPGAVYGLQVGIVGTEGVIDIEDTHRDLVMATEKPICAGYTSRNYKPELERHGDFLTSYPPGDMNDGQLWGPMRDETNSWFGRIHTGLKTPHASAAEGHRNLLLTMAMDLSARRGTEIKLPLDLDEFYK